MIDTFFCMNLNKETKKITDFVKGNKLSGIDLYQLAIMQLELLKSGSESSFLCITSSGILSFRWQFT
ncbi:hypothetical protein GCM10020331_051060 [Ectobacillus funiculus]